MSRLSRQDSRKSAHVRDGSTGTSFHSDEVRRGAGARVSTGFGSSVKCAEDTCPVVTEGAEAGFENEGETVSDAAAGTDFSDAAGQDASGAEKAFV